MIINVLKTTAHNHTNMLITIKRKKINQFKQIANFKITINNSTVVT